MNTELYAHAVALANRPYSVVIEHDATADPAFAWVAQDVELSGCMAQGGSIEEAQRELVDARADYICSLLEHGVDVPAPAWSTPGTKGALTTVIMRVDCSA